MEAKASAMSSMRFLCQSCSQPLRLTESAETLGLDTSQQPAAWKLPSARAEPREGLEEGPPSRLGTGTGKLRDGASCRTVPGEGRVSRYSSNDFILLGNLGSGRTLNSIQKATQGIADILSGEEIPDHPLCEDCTDNLLEQLDAHLAIAASDSRNYKRHLETRERTSQGAWEVLRHELQAAEREEARLVRELEEVEQRREGAAAALRAARAETETLDRRERQHQREYSDLKWQQLELHDELRSLENRLRYAQARLHRLENTDAFRAAFEIRHRGPVASINRFRLGCLPSVPVGWDEINAAWGQAALLLLALAKAVGLRFQRFRLVPCGNRSYLESLSEDAAELHLFCNGEQGAFVYSRFDRAMVAFLDCMQQFQAEAEKGESGVRMPCRIHAEKGLLEEPGAGGQLCSIRTHRNTEEQWTRALKLMLINFEQSLAWVSLRYLQK